MMSLFINPFNPNDPDRYQIWEMLVHRDIEAFVINDWDQVADDFIEEGFTGVDARFSSNPDSWNLVFPHLKSYQQFWLEQAANFTGTDWEDDPLIKLNEATTLRDIDISGDSALVHKKFDGTIKKMNGQTDVLNWQTLYRCRKVGRQWKIAGFIGFLPNPMGNTAVGKPPVELPEQASQHVTAGPYSPVLQINPGQIVVISGQAAINKEGEIIGDTIEEQTELTLENCRTQLETGGSSLDDAFKVNVYLKDLDHWPRFNEVYKKYFREPLPVRTAVQTGLLSTLLVEIEIWAIKK
ncbi:MAG: RidA family protein [Cyclobacteriaceae bacterium]|nr:RidA family protein [Cyclobacteriaceae bacterium]MCK5372601.1 RidA family protein [Cyclobacteriaceae bacterium]